MLLTEIVALIYYPSDVKIHLFIWEHKFLKVLTMMNVLDLKFNVNLYLFSFINHAQTHVVNSQKSEIRA